MLGDLPTHHAEFERKVLWSLPQSEAQAFCSLLNMLLSAEIMNRRTVCDGAAKSLGGVSDL
jgi:hypothetical protein